MRSSKSLAVKDHKASPDIPIDRRFRRESRLAEKACFARVFEKAQRSRDKLFTVLYRPNGTGRPRLGLAIGKKNCKLSVGRNRLKRIVRESFRHQRSMLGGVDIVILNQAQAARADSKTLFESLDTHWKKCARKFAQSTPAPGKH